MPPPFSRMLSVVLPTPPQTAMLRSMLWDGERGRGAWHTWQERFGGPRHTLEGPPDGYKRLLPLLHRAARRLEVPLDPIIRTLLHTAYAREEARSRTLRRVCHEAFGQLAAREIPFAVLRGIALAETTYGDPALRHCHDCDLLVDQERRGSAAAALAAMSAFTVFRREDGPAVQRTIVVHESGLPIHLHEQPFRLPVHHAAREAMWRRASPARLCGVDTLTLAATDTLLQVCAHAAAHASRQSGCWVADGWMILAEERPLDWDLFLETAIESRLGLPLSVTLGYLAETLDAPVPLHVLEGLAAAAARSDTMEREAAMFGASAGADGGPRRLLGRAAHWRERLAVTKWMLLPAPAHVRWAYDLRRPGQVGLYYLYRPFRGVMRRLRRLLRASPEPRLPEFMK